MKKLGLDQATSWLLATMLAGGLTVGAYLLLTKMARDPSELVLARLDKEKKEQESKAAIEMQNSNQSLKESAGPEWTYAGSTGPEHWGGLSREYSLCRRGREQSPLDINHAALSGTLPRLVFHYGKQGFRLENTGRGFVGEFTQGSDLAFGSKKFKLSHFDLHLPSEHSLDGMPFDMELQLSHLSPTGEVLNVALFIREGEDDNRELRAIWSAFSSKKGVDGKTSQVELDKLLPKSTRYFSYMGSLSQPPCTEGVRWIVLEKPIEASSAQIDRFISIYRNNSRPIQGINKRSVLKSKSR